jgi:hypothetical protein
MPMEALILGVSFILFVLVLISCQKAILQNQALSIEAGSMFSVLPLLSILPFVMIQPSSGEGLHDYLSLGYLVPCLAFSIVGMFVSSRLFKKRWRFKILAAMNLMLIALYVTATLKATYAIGF